MPEWLKRILAGRSGGSLYGQAPFPTVEGYTTPDIYSTRPPDMPGNLSFTPWLTQKGGYDVAAHEGAKERWQFMDDMRLRKLERMSKLMKGGPLAPASIQGGGTREAQPFFAQTAPVSRGPVDILAPEVETLDEIYRKRENMFRMV